MQIVKLKKGKENRVINGYPWIFANEVLGITGEGKNGQVVKVVSNDDRFVCIGAINYLSKIQVRVLSRTELEIDYSFFKNIIENCKNQRENLGFSNNYRVVFGENDLLPGLIVDKYGDYLSIQITSLFIDNNKENIIKALVELFNPKGIYERSDVNVRLKEGLKLFKGTIYGDPQTKVQIVENGLTLVVDLENGQKTGYFLDQKENRDNLKYYVKDKQVLDLFCNEGGFSLCASKYGAKEVVSVDISKTALDLVNENAKLNGFTNIKTEQADVFEYLRQIRQDKQKYDVIVLDPPAFTKSSDTVQSAIKGYKDINIQALKCVKQNGYLVTCSCSQHLTIPLFLDMIKQSSIESGIKVQMVEFRTQAKDHSTLISFDEGLYLKVAILRII